MQGANLAYELIDQARDLGNQWSRREVETVEYAQAYLRALVDLTSRLTGSEGWIVALALGFEPGPLALDEPVS